MTDSSTKWYYLHADHQGSIIAQSNDQETVLNTASYDSYGIPSNNNIDRFGYTGQIWFKELGLFYYKARWYHPKIGRFLQTDPIGYKGNMNLYAYVGNDPINKTGPTGMFGYYPGFYELSVQFSNPTVTSTVMDFTPVVGDIQAIGEAIADPSAINVTVAAVGMVPGIGDAAGKAIKTGENLKSLTSKTNVGEMVKTPDNSKESFTKLKGGQGFKDNKTGTIMQRSNTNHSNSPGGEFKAGTKPGEAPEPSKKVTISGGPDGGCVLKKDGC